MVIADTIYTALLGIQSKIDWVDILLQEVCEFRFIIVVVCWVLCILFVIRMSFSAMKFIESVNIIMTFTYKRIDK